MAVRAPAFGERVWHNSEPLDLEALRGRAVLLDFFTYGCINCLNNLHAIETLRTRYGANLVVIGVHSGKFARERDDAALASALKRLGIIYPVVNDADAKLFDAYAVKAWPSMVLIDARGYEVGRWSGEGKETEIAAQLDAMGIAVEPLQRSIDVQTASQLHFPTKILAADDFLAVANTGAGAVVVYDYDGKLQHVYDGLSAPMGMALDGQTLYVAERGANAVVRIDLQDGTRETLLEALRNPYDLQLTDSELIVALAGGHRIAVYDRTTMEERYFIGNGSEALRDGSYAACQLAQPSGLAYDGYRLWFIDAESSSLRYAEAGEVKTAVGEGLFTFGDRIEEPRLMQHPEDLAIGIIGDGCGGGRLFIVDTYNGKVKVYSPDDGAMFEILDGLHGPSGIAKKGCSLYIADTDAHRIARFDLQQMKLHRFV